MLVLAIAVQSSKLRFVNLFKVIITGLDISFKVNVVPLIGVIFFDIQMWLVIGFKMLVDADVMGVIRPMSQRDDGRH